MFDWDLNTDLRIATFSATRLEILQWSQNQAVSPKLSIKIIFYYCMKEKNIILFLSVALGYHFNLSKLNKKIDSSKKKESSKKGILKWISYSILHFKQIK